MSFSTALAAMSAHAKAVDVVGHNLANLNTTGFKSNSVSFQEMVAQSLGTAGQQIGGGVGPVQTSRNSGQGAVQATSGLLDAAIRGNGFFVVRDTAGNQLFTRSGSFQLDGAGALRTSTGESVQGWMEVNGQLNTNGAIGNIVFPSGGLRQPFATTKISAGVNLDASGEAGKPSGSFSTPIEVVDSLGASHVLQVTFTKSGANQWDYDVTIPKSHLTAGGEGSESLGTGALEFDDHGRLTSPAAADGSISLAVAGLANGAADLKIDWNLYGPDGAATLTQYSQPSATSTVYQDGAAAAELTGVAIQDAGRIIARYSNGREQAIGQLALASILNPDSLVAAGNNNYQLGAASAAPVIGVAATGGRGDIVGGALEASTVDLAREFTNLLVYQRGYQASSRVISTIDELTQETLGLKR